MKKGAYVIFNLLTNQEEKKVGYYFKHKDILLFVDKEGSYWNVTETESGMLVNGRISHLTRTMAMESAKKNIDKYIESGSNIHQFIKEKATYMRQLTKERLETKS